MDNTLPQPVKTFRNDYSDVWSAFKELGGRCHEAGPLDERVRRLVKIALAIGVGSEGATHSAVRNALASGVASEEIRHVAVMAITTLGFPSAMRAMTWVGDCINPEAK